MMKKRGRGGKSFRQLLLSFTKVFTPKGFDNLGRLYNRKAADNCQ